MPRKMIDLPDDLWSAIDAYRWEHKMPSEVAAIRELLRRGLEKEAQG